MKTTPNPFTDKYQRLRRYKQPTTIQPNELDHVLGDLLLLTRIKKQTGKKTLADLLR